MTLSYEESKVVAIEELHDTVWRAHGWRKGLATTEIKDIVVKNLGGEDGEYAANRAARIVRESGLTLASRSRRWHTQGTSESVHFGKLRLALRISIVSNEVPKTVRDRGLVIGTVYKYIRDRQARAYYMQSLCFKVTVVVPEAHKPRPWAAPISCVKYQQEYCNC